MPDKRRDSKDRRAARNKAQRGALAARRENAAASEPASSPGSSAKSSSAKSSSARGSASGRRGGSTGARGARPARPIAIADPPAPGGLLGQIRNPRPGDWAVLIAFGLAIVAGIATLFVLKVPVDDQGNTLPREFGAVALMARSTLVGHTVTAEHKTYLAAYGAQALILIVLPIAVVGFAVWANRRPDRSRLLTYAMVALGAAVILQVGSPLFIVPFMALLVAGFKVRRADMVPMEERGAAPAAGRKGRDVIDVDATDTTEPTDAIEDAGSGRDGVESDDPLERLEAEMEAERAVEAEGDGEPDGSGGGRKRRR